MSYLKRVEDLVLSPNETRKSWKRVGDSLKEMHHDDLKLSKDYEKFMEENFSIMQTSFENSLQQVEIFYINEHIFREKVQHDLEMVDGKSVFLGTIRPRNFLLYMKSLPSGILAVNESYNCLYMAFSHFLLNIAFTCYLVALVPHVCFFRNLMWST